MAKARRKRKISATYNLQTVFPALAKQWHPELNKPVTAKDVLPHSGKKVWWKCKEGHEWEARIFSRSGGAGCPYCSGNLPTTTCNFQRENPKVAKQWHPTKNNALRPSDFRPNSRKKVWWVCKEGHEWEASIHSRNQGTGCPFCTGQKPCEDNCLATRNPALAAQWHPTKNGKLTPFDVTPNSCRKVWWKCSRGHSWIATPNNRNYGTGCPHCYRESLLENNSLQVNNPALAAQWHPTKNGKLTARDVTPHSNKAVWWKCPKGHVWQASIHDRNKGTGCPKCKKLRKAQKMK